MFKKVALFCAVLPLGLVGCASAPIAQKMPEVADGEGCDVLVVRPGAFVGAGDGAVINLNGQDLVRLGNGAHVRFSVSRDQHQLLAKRTSLGLPVGSDETQFECKHTEPHHFKVSQQLFGIKLSDIAAEEAEQIASKTADVNAE